MLLLVVINVVEMIVGNGTCSNNRPVNSTCTEGKCVNNTVKRELVNSNNCSKNSKSTVKNFDRCQFENSRKSMDVSELTTCHAGTTRIIRDSKTNVFKYNNISTPVLSKTTKYVKNLCAKSCPIGTKPAGPYKLFCDKVLLPI